MEALILRPLVAAEISPTRASVGELLADVHVLLLPFGETAILLGAVAPTGDLCTTSCRATGYPPRSREWAQLVGTSEQTLPQYLFLVSVLLLGILAVFLLSLLQSLQYQSPSGTSSSQTHLVWKLY